MLAPPPPPQRQLGLFAACAAAVAALLAGFQAVPEDLNPGLLLAAQAAGTSLLLTLVAVGWAALGRKPVRERLGLGPGRAGPGLVLLLAVGLLGLSHALDRGIELFDLRKLSHLTQVDAAVSSAFADSGIWLFLGLALAPGFGEEIFFRGCVQRGLVPWLGRLGALTASAAIFGAFHGDLVHGVGAAFLGLYLGAVADLSGGTRAAIACHVLNNVGAVGGMALPAPTGIASEWLAAGGLAVAGGALVIASRRLRPPAPLQTAAPPADP